jgi:hypothetical protein
MVKADGGPSREARTRYEVELTGGIDEVAGSQDFANANPPTQTGVVVLECFHTMHMNNSVIFQVRAGFANILQSLGGRNSVEDEANAAAAEALQKCGPG